MNLKREVSGLFWTTFKYLYAYCVLRPSLSHSLSAVHWNCNQTSPLFLQFDKIWFSVKLFGMVEYSIDRVYVYFWSSTILRNTGTRQLCNLHACSQVFATAYKRLILRCKLTTVRPEIPFTHNDKSYFNNCVYNLVGVKCIAFDIQTLEWKKNYCVQFDKRMHIFTFDCLIKTSE